ncbi:MAG TPA: hypothetical protein DGG95_15480 [Cytophagales bacterium]|jgi:PAS domain S-box-containing protein|nr:hypothetical protein [Cytophagales bacterium]
MNQVTLFSETDTSGRIIFVNDVFCEVSGFTRNELIGQPHNIVRHPEMPKELFRYLWVTIAGGNIFRGVIKNKAKDGSHYWVSAIIMPWMQGEKKIEKYVSIRHLITNEHEAQDLFLQQAKLLPSIDKS